MSSFCKYVNKNKHVFMSAVGIVTTFILLLFIESVISKQSVKYKTIEITKNCKVTINNDFTFYGDIANYKQHKLKRGDKIRLDFELDDKTIEKPIVYFENQNAIVNVIYDGEKIFQAGDIHDNVIGYQRIKIPIPDDYAGKKLTIEMQIIDNSIKNNIQKMNLVNAFDADRKFMADNIISIFVGIYLLTVGLTGLLFITTLFGNDKSLRKIMWIAAMGISSGIWILTYNNAIEYFTNNYKLNYYIEYLTMFLAFVFLSLYVLESMKEDIFRTIVRYLLCALYIFCIMSTILTVSGVLFYGNILFIFHIIMLLIVLTTIVGYSQNRGMSLFKDRMKVAEFIMLFIMVLTYMIVSRFNQTIATKALGIIPIITLIFLSSNFANFIVKFMKNYKSKEEDKTLLDLAYNDTLTKIGNRRAFDRYINEIEVSCEKPLAIFSFDLNSLKRINDLFGHSYGDELLIGFAEGLDSVNNSSFVGRIGGDEFVAFIEDADYNKAETFVKELKDNIDIKNDNLPDERKISYAIGYEIYYPQDENMSIQDCLFAADDNMYLDKEIIKEKND